MEYNCVIKHGCRKESWTGNLRIVDRRPGQCELEITGRGTYFHVIAGSQRNGNYICIPNHNVGSELSDFSDMFWNTERLSGLMRKVDAVTVATGLREFRELCQAEDLAFL